jgi:hypothetical protein
MRYPGGLYPRLGARHEKAPAAIQADGRRRCGGNELSSTSSLVYDPLNPLPCLGGSNESINQRGDRVLRAFRKFLIRQPFQILVHHFEPPQN